MTGNDRKAACLASVGKVFPQFWPHAGAPVARKLEREQNIGRALCTRMLVTQATSTCVLAFTKKKKSGQQMSNINPSAPSVVPRPHLAKELIVTSSIPSLASQERLSFPYRSPFWESTKKCWQSYWRNKCSIIGAKLLVKLAIMPMPYLINVSFAGLYQTLSANRKEVNA